MLSVVAAVGWAAVGSAAVQTVQWTASPAPPHLALPLSAAIRFEWGDPVPSLGTMAPSVRQSPAQGSAAHSVATTTTQSSPGSGGTTNRPPASTLAAHRRTRRTVLANVVAVAATDGTREGIVYRSGEPTEAGNVTIPLMLFEGANEVTFTSDGDPALTMTLTLTGRDNESGTETEVGAGRDRRQSQGGNSLAAAALWSSVGVVALALVVALAYKRKQHTHAVSKDNAEHSMYEDDEGREDVFHLETPDVTTRHERRRPSTTITPPLAARRPSLAKTVSTHGGNNADQAQSGLLDFLRAERRYWMTNRPQAAAANTTTVESAAPTATRSMSGWKWPYNQAREWLSGSRSSLDTTTDPTSKLEEVDEVTSVMTVHRSNDSDTPADATCTASPPATPTPSTDMNDSAAVEQPENWEASTPTSEGEQTDGQRVPNTAARRRFDYFLPGATFHDSPRVVPDPSRAALQSVRRPTTGYMDVESTGQDDNDEVEKTLDTPGPEPSEPVVHDADDASMMRAQTDDEDEASEPTAPGSPMARPRTGGGSSVKQSPSLAVVPLSPNDGPRSRPRMVSSNESDVVQSQPKQQSLPFLVARALQYHEPSKYDLHALFFFKGDYIHVLHQHANGLWEGRVVTGRNAGVIGHFPFTLVEPVQPEEYDDKLHELKQAYEADKERYSPFLADGGEVKPAKKQRDWPFKL
eukprot:m.28531 g.28531  ORF g.28531 m.28531 type:complete len:694 (+) comp4526_c0_seq1:37-2118(+)